MFWMWVNKDYVVYSVLLANAYNMIQYVCISEEKESADGV